MSDDDLQVLLTNREKIRKPTSGWTYCYGCDASKLNKGETCTICGFTLGTKQARKRDIKVYDN